MRKALWLILIAALSVTVSIRSVYAAGCSQAFNVALGGGVITERGNDYVIVTPVDIGGGPEIRLTTGDTNLGCGLDGSPTPVTPAANDVDGFIRWVVVGDDHTQITTGPFSGSGLFEGVTANGWQFYTLNVQPMRVNFSGSILNASFTATPTTCQAPCTVTVTDTSTGDIASSFINWGDGSDLESVSPPGSGATLNHTYETAGSYTITLTIYDPTLVQDTATQQITVTEGGGWTRPLKSEDEHPQWGMWDWQRAIDTAGSETITSSFPEAVEVFSSRPDAPVAAIRAGTVIDVVQLNEENCPQRSSGETLRRKVCIVAIPPYFTQEEEDVTGRPLWYIFGWEYVNLSRVIIRDSEDSQVTYTYFIQNPKVQPGDAVNAGCVLGTTIQLKNLTNAVLDGISADIGTGISLDGSGPSFGINAGIGISLAFQNTLLPYGHARIYRAGATAQRIWPQLTLQPSLSDCATSTLGSCLTESPDFQDLNVWEYINAELSTEGMILREDGSIRQRGIVINPATEYVVRFVARASGTRDGSIFARLRLGNGAVQTEFMVTETRTMTVFEYQIPDTSAIIVGGQTDIQLTNASGLTGDSGEIIVGYICLAPLTANIQPGACYFVNHNFESDGLRWVVNSGTPRFQNGEAWLNNGNTISQLNVALEPGSYTLRVVARLLATGDYSGQSGKEVDLQYRYPETGDYSSVGIIDAVRVQDEGKNILSEQVLIDHAYTLTATLTITESTSSTFFLRTVVTDPENFLQGLRIDSACLKPSSGDWPGDGGWTPPFVERCEAVPPPIENSIGPWIFYHWKNSERFFECDLMKLLNQQFQMLDNFQRTARLFMRYWIVTVQYGAVWVGDDFLPWLDGHFRNMAVGQVTTIYSGEEQCHDIFCLIDNIVSGGLDQLITPILNMLQQILDALLPFVSRGAGLIFAIIEGIIRIFLSMARYALSLMMMAQQLLGTIINAYNNSAPIPIPGLPNCGFNPKAHAICVGIWILDNTVFSGPGVVIIPLIVGILSIHLILWAVGQIRELVTALGQSAA